MFESAANLGTLHLDATLSTLVMSFKRTLKKVITPSRVPPARASRAHGHQVAVAIGGCGAEQRESQFPLLGSTACTPTCHADRYCHHSRHLFHLQAEQIERFLAAQANGQGARARRQQWLTLRSDLQEER